MYTAYIYTRMVQAMTFQCIYSQEADVHYTQLTQV